MIFFSFCYIAFFNKNKLVFYLCLFLFFTSIFTFFLLFNFSFEAYSVLDFNNLGPVNIKNNTIKQLSPLEKFQLSTFFDKAVIDNCFYDSSSFNRNYFLENFNNYNCYLLEEENCYICLQKSVKIDECFNSDFKYCKLTNKLTCLENYNKFRRGFF